MGVCIALERAFLGVRDTLGFLLMVVGLAISLSRVLCIIVA